MPDEYNSKVVLGNGTVLIDLTADTVAAGNLYSGYTAHGSDGAPITGTYLPTVRTLSTSQNGTYNVPTGVDGYSQVVVDVPSGFYGKAKYANDISAGYVYSGEWRVDANTSARSDVYLVSNGVAYIASLGSTVGTLFRVLYTSQDPSEASSTLSGTSYSNKSNPVADDFVKFIAPGDGYLTITKDDVGTSGLASYLYELFDGDHPTVATLTEKTITQNGTYLASADNADGYFRIVVNV